MAKIITRYFETVEKAKQAQYELVEMRRLPQRDAAIYTTPDALRGLSSAGDFDDKTLKEYKKRLGKGGAVLMVRAGYKPLGVAAITREVVVQSGAVDLGDLVEEITVKDEVRTPGDRILSSHPRMMTRLRDPDSKTFHMANWPIPLLSRRKPSDLSLFPRHARMATWPIGLLSPSKVRFGRFPFDLLVPKNRFMAKFPFGHIVPGHKFMAKFPFAHLVPGHKYMANFPIGHLVPEHKYMANFVFPHTEARQT